MITRTHTPSLTRRLVLLFFDGEFSCRWSLFFRKELVVCLWNSRDLTGEWQGLLAYRRISQEGLVYRRILRDIAGISRRVPCLISRCVDLARRLRDRGAVRDLTWRWEPSTSPLAARRVALFARRISSRAVSSLARQAHNSEFDLISGRSFANQAEEARIVVGVSAGAIGRNHDRSPSHRRDRMTPESSGAPIEPCHSIDGTTVEPQQNRTTKEHQCNLNRTPSNQSRASRMEPIQPPIEPKQSLSHKEPQSRASASIEPKAEPRQPQPHTEPQSRASASNRTPKQASASINLPKQSLSHKEPQSRAPRSIEPKQASASIEPQSRASASIENPKQSLSLNRTPKAEPRFIKPKQSLSLHNPKAELASLNPKARALATTAEPQSRASATIEPQSRASATIEPQSRASATIEPHKARARPSKNPKASLTS
ncbi:hypothetical protein C7M84_020047 [Penaeus vannamei]|uniref:Uncharacterized protein n=1 Tax=Penaeus vannamei TaxID=6689 RepID=A0A3R7PDB7_PENVA|nr:hypothetical protein C7M84_020047 [Penaeus vannamei]